MLTIGDQFPDFDLAAVVGARDPHIDRVRREDYEGKWLVVFFWPKDFTFVCPTEIAGFAKAEPRFSELGASILGASIDNEYVHLAWRAQHPHLRTLPFPMASDLKRELVHDLGILDKDEGVALRATFIVDPEGVIRFVSVYDLDTGRSVDEVLRTLEALQTGGLTACGWEHGQETLLAS
ncbi:MAG TPA: peroxiredoxin [Acidimicrobiales bacterium]|nr:peroxiredoxin [Acidimicrobiales bacterium]